MLVPAKSQIYTEKWHPLGQRRAETILLVSFNNNVVHQFRLSWFINEQSEQFSWMSITAEKLLGVKKHVLPPSGDTKPLRSNDAINFDGEPFEKIAFMSNTSLDGPICIALMKAGIIEEVTEDDGKKRAKEHIKNVEAYMSNRSCDPKVSSWIKSKGGTGAQRVVPFESLFNSTLNIHECKIM